MHLILGGVTELWLVAHVFFYGIKYISSERGELLVERVVSFVHFKIPSKLTLLGDSSRFPLLSYHKEEFSNGRNSEQEYSEAASQLMLIFQKLSV